MSRKSGFVKARGGRFSYLSSLSRWAAALIWLVIIGVASILASLLPAARAGRISVREALSYE